MHDKID